MDDFSEHPKTIGEVRAGKTENAKDWSPRDVLVRMLRQIDSGQIKPEQLMVLYVLPEDGESCIRPIGYQMSTPDPTYMIGVLERAKQGILED